MSGEAATPPRRAHETNDEGAREARDAGARCSANAVMHDAGYQATVRCLLDSGHGGSHVISAVAELCDLRAVRRASVSPVIREEPR